ncbi:Retrovirus-related Pol polyprotein from transposon 17.6 [Chionoecetes opilio]|uniref:Retrovirus-related Pol polyprotein from transposon 17.6 n=1 Tax=Chionoecetes opilio TaxID=41210 RepID=A0A8J4Y7Z0_CHIOP|nr:Retrovirus-related Pol polyprotein from transposon 17.6 [Chionoecetes opilio]
MRARGDYLLQQGLAIPSQSPWASTMYFLVPKEDGQLRLCHGLPQSKRCDWFRRLPSTKIDDLIDKHLLKRPEVFDQLQGAQLTHHDGKTTFSRATVTYLGHEVDKGKYDQMATSSAILEVPCPYYSEGPTALLGMAGLLPRFCPNFAAAYRPSHPALTSGAVTYNWDGRLPSRLQQLKNFLFAGPVLIAPDFAKPFALQTDASDTALVSCTLTRG